MAYTSDLSRADSSDSKIILLRVNGSQSQKILPNLPGDDYERNKGDLWKLSIPAFFGFPGCVTAKDVKTIGIINAGSDGWNIDSIVTFLVADQHHYQLSSVDLDIYQWIDDNHPHAQVYLLSLTL